MLFLGIDKYIEKKKETLKPQQGQGFENCQLLSSDKSNYWEKFTFL